MATTTIAQTRTPQLSRLQTFGIVAGVIGIALLALGYFTDTQQFAESYLFGMYFTMAFPIGCLGFLMLQHLTGGAWAVTVRRILEAGAITMPIMFILFLPNILTAYNFYGLEHYVYEWANPAVVTPGGGEFDPIIAHKTPWLSPDWYTGRAVIYFVIWSALALILRTWSRQQDRGDKGATKRMQLLSGIGVALFVLTVTFASFDWSMSLEPHWFSTIYGAHYMINAGLSTLALMILVLSMVRETPLYKEHVTTKPIHDIGKLMLAFTVLWTYMSYGQYAIIWSGDVAEFTPWYVDRGQGGWLWVAMGLMACSFFLPFFLLLGRKPKKNINYLVGVAILILVMRFVDVSWIMLPSFHDTVAGISWMDLVAPLGLLGVWLAMFAFNYQRAPMLPLNDHNMENLHAGGHH